jgi:tetratricopeptide (TPR) repeat protein
MSAMSDGGDPGDDEAVRLHERAIELRDAGRYEEAATTCREAVLLFEALEGVESPNVANALVEQGRIADARDRHADAEAAFDRALGILRPLLAADGDSDGDLLDPQALDELTRLTVRAEIARADLIRKRGRLDEAEAACRLALRRAEQNLPPDDLLIAEALNALGVIHKFEGRYVEAEPLYRRALGIVEAGGGGAEHEATLLHNLGGLAHSRGDFAAGEPLARRSVELREGLWGREHPAVAADREAWGALLEGMGRLADAERAYRDALAVFEASLGPGSLEAASSLTALASVQHTRGDLDDALVSYRRALGIRQAKLGPHHFDLALTLNNLAMLLVDRGDRDEARVTLGRAHTIFEASLGPEHPHTRAAAANLAALSER